MGFGASAVSDVCSNSIRVLKVYKCGAASIAPTRLDFPEQPRNRKCDHPRPRLMETSRVDGVKAPLHDGTPRYAHAFYRYFRALVGRREDDSAEGARAQLLII